MADVTRRMLSYEFFLDQNEKIQSVQIRAQYELDNPLNPGLGVFEIRKEFLSSAEDFTPADRTSFTSLSSRMRTVFERKRPLVLTP